MPSKNVKTANQAKKSKKRAVISVTYESGKETFNVMLLENEVKVKFLTFTDRLEAGKIKNKWESGTFQFLNG
jgi:hypothetical protein